MDLFVLLFVLMWNEKDVVHATQGEYINYLVLFLKSYPPKENYQINEQFVRGSDNLLSRVFFLSVEQNFFSGPL